MTQRQHYPFRIVRGTTAPSFSSTANSTAQALALESTALLRIWPGPSTRTVRVAESSGTDYFVNFGSSTVTVGNGAGTGSTDSILVLGGTVETFHVEPGQTHIAIQSGSSTLEAEVNITIGHGA